jgi:DNA (cytosine-5)-methyltransferase 1
MLRVIDQVRPMWVVGENFNGITTMVESFEVTEMGSESSLFNEGDGVHRYRSEQTFTIERICRDLESKGYSVQPMLIPAAAVGAPHRRDRIFILAYNVADSDSGNDLRESGEHEGKSSEEWISERNEVRKPGKSDYVRSETEGTLTNTYSNRKYKVHQYLQSELTDGKEFICDGRIRNVANSECERLERKNESQCSEGRKQMQVWRDVTGYYRKAALQPQERWKAFPTISPVSRRNDGIPFDVDSLTIPFGKWKVETIKAYGNAIVPQVIYQIMKVINDISKNN